MYYVDLHVDAVVNESGMLLHDRNSCLNDDGLNRFAQICCAPKRSNCYEHRIFNITAIPKTQWKTAYNEI